MSNKENLTGGAVGKRGGSGRECVNGKGGGGQGRCVGDWGGGGGRGKVVKKAMLHWQQLLARRAIGPYYKGGCDKKFPKSSRNTREGMKEMKERRY